MITIAHNNQITREPFPPWLTPEYRIPQTIQINFTPSERRIYRKRKPIKPSAWTEKHRFVSDGPLAGGKWSGKLTPHLKDMMDAAFFPSVREIIHCKSVQSGGTTQLENCIGYAIDRRPGPALIVYPDQKTATDNCRDNLQPMIKSSPRLKTYLTGVHDDVATLRIKLDSMVIHMGWAGSAVSLGNKSVLYLVLDELDKFPARPNKNEPATIALVEKRNTAYLHDYKRWKNSTPTVESGAIWQALTKIAQVIFERWGKCPLCGKIQLIKFGGYDDNGQIVPGGIRWPQGAEHADIENNKLAWYECEHCQGHWDDRGRDKANQAGEWRAKDDGREIWKYLREERPAKIGFHNPAWISPFVPLSESAARFVKGQTDKEALKDWCNNYAAKPWKVVVGKEIRTSSIMDLKTDSPPNIVPSWALGLILTADVQGNGIWYELRAWDEEETSQLVRYGFIVKGLDYANNRGNGDFISLSKIADSPYYTASGEEYRVEIGLVDSGYRTDTVYDFCRSKGFMIPSKGQVKKATPYNTTKIDTMPGTGVLIEGGIQLVNVHTTYWKDRLADKLKINNTDPGAWALHSDTHEDYAIQYTSEMKDEEKGLWVQRGNQPNHLWDCGVLQLVAYRIRELQNNHWQRLARQKSQQNQKTADQTTTVAKSSYMQR